MILDSIVTDVSFYGMVHERPWFFSAGKRMYVWVWVCVCVFVLSTLQTLNCCRQSISIGISCLMANKWYLGIYGQRTAMKLQWNRLELILKVIGFYEVNIECQHFNRLQNKHWSRAGTGNDRIVFIGLLRVSVFDFSWICSRNLDLQPS